MFGGISPPGGIPAISYTQVLLASCNQNRVSIGLGIVDVVPGLDLDTFAGGSTAGRRPMRENQGATR